VVEIVASSEWRQCDDVAAVMQTRQVGRKSREGREGVKDREIQVLVGGGSEIGAGRSQTD
jgi:hypothetical protein